MITEQGYAEKEVVISVARMCFSKSSLVEVLRMAAGLSSGLGAHRVSLVFTGDGVVQALKEHVTEDCQKYLTYAKMHKISLFVDKYCMLLRGLKPEQMMEGCIPVTREQLLDKLDRADAHLRL